MKNFFAPFLMLSIFTVLFFACSPKSFGEQEVRYMLENAVFSPEQAFSKYETFYMRTERIIVESSAAGIYINALNKDSYNMNALFENKVVQELFIDGNKLRLSSYVESLTMPLELHFIYDGENLQTVSNFAQKDSRKITFQQAKDFISFPGSDFFKRIRADFEQSGKQIQYKYGGTEKYNGYNCHIFEIGLKDDDKRAIFFVDKKTNIVVKSKWDGVFSNDLEGKKISKIKGKKVPVIVEMFYGQYFTAIVKYQVKINDHIHPDIFNETNILLPMRSMYKEKMFLEESVDRKRARIRVVLDSIQSFEFVLNNMHLTNAYEGFSGAEIESIEIQELTNRLIPDNTSAYRIPIASNEQSEKKKQKQQTAKSKQPLKKAAAVRLIPVQNENDETDWLEYSPRDAYRAIEAELEDMKEANPEEYVKMKKILDEMKEKDEKVKNIAGH